MIYLLRREHETTSHYVYIKHISRLLNLATHVEDKDKRFCPFCSSKIQCHKYDTHIRTCHTIQMEGSILQLPEPGSVMKFQNHKNKIVRPFIIYADTECTLVKTNDNNKIHEHVVNSCCYYFVCSFDSSRNYIKTFVGDTCLRDMVMELVEVSSACIKAMQHNEKMEMSPKDAKAFNHARCCYLCGEKFVRSDKQIMKVRDHDHRTGQYRGAAHACCNINYFCNRYLPVVFHNLRGYDGHLIIKEAYELGKKGYISHP